MSRTNGDEEGHYKWELDTERFYKKGKEANEISALADYDGARHSYPVVLTFPIPADIQVWIPVRGWIF